MILSNTMLVCMIVFTFLMLVIFLFKNKSKSPLSIRFVILMCLVIFLLLYNLFGSTYLRKVGIDSSLMMFMSRVYIATFYSVFFFMQTYFTAYVFEYNIPMNPFTSKVNVIFSEFYLVIYFLFYCLPNNVALVNDAFSFTGVASILCYFCCAATLVADYILFFIRIKTVDVRKAIPMLVTPFYFIAAILAYNICDAPFLEMAQVLSIITIYFMAEKPDVKIQKYINDSIINLDNSSKLKTDFISNTSHELKTPLNAIIANSNSLLENKKISSSYKKDLRDILYSSYSLYSAINNVLLISKIENNVTFSKSIYNLKDETNNLHAIHSMNEYKGSINFLTEYSSNVPDVIYGEKNEVMILINNVLSYSFMKLNKGSVVLKYDWDIKEDGKTYLIVKVDNISESSGELYTNISDDETKIYDYVDEADASEFCINFANVIAKKLGASVYYQYENGIQNSIIINIPQEKSTESFNISDVSYKGKKVLVVDDSELNLRIATKILSSMDFEVKTCLNGKDAINDVKYNTYDVILLDINMPNLNGEGTLNGFKENSEFNTPVIALTADEDTHARDKYLGMGFAGYVLKPFTKNDLVAGFDKILERGEK